MDHESLRELPDDLFRRARVSAHVRDEWIAAPDDVTSLDLHLRQHESHLERMGRNITTPIDTTTFFLRQQQQRASMRHRSEMTRALGIVRAAGGEGEVASRVPEGILTIRITPRALADVLRRLGPDLDRLVAHPRQQPRR